MPHRHRRYPFSCPICRVAMVGEKSREDLAGYDVQRCLRCDTVVHIGAPAAEEDRKDDDQAG
jgi:hypothetical protein